MEKTSILIVDDEQEIRDLLEIYLRNEGFDVIQAENGTEAIKIMRTNKVELIILDIMMPEMNGMEACIKIRKEYALPIIMLSAKGEPADRIQGIMTGADDYVSKPFNPLEIVVRVKAILKRYRKGNVEATGNRIEINDLIIDTDMHQVTVNDKNITLTNKEFEILKLLAENKGIVFSSRRIYENIWNEEFYESDSTIMTHIRNLREKLGDNLKESRYIKTIWGVGYKFER